MEKRTCSVVGEKISFETSAANITKLIHETVSIVDDFDKQIGLEIIEIEPIEDSKLEVTAKILWVEADDPPKE